MCPACLPVGQCWSPGVTSVSLPCPVPVSACVCGRLSPPPHCSVQRQGRRLSREEITGRPMPVPKEEEDFSHMKLRPVEPIPRATGRRRSSIHEDVLHCWVCRAAAAYRLCSARRVTARLLRATARRTVALAPLCTALCTACSRPCGPADLTRALLTGTRPGRVAHAAAPEQTGNESALS